MNIDLNIETENVQLQIKLCESRELYTTLTSVSGSAVNWKAFRENLRVVSVREMNREAPGSLLLSSIQLWMTTISG